MGASHCKFKMAVTAGFKSPLATRLGRQQHKLHLGSAYTKFKPRPKKIWLMHLNKPNDLKSYLFVVITKINRLIGIWNIIHHQSKHGSLWKYSILIIFSKRSMNNFMENTIHDVEPHSSWPLPTCPTIPRFLKGFVVGLVLGTPTKSRFNFWLENYVKLSVQFRVVLIGIYGYIWCLLHHWKTNG